MSTDPSEFRIAGAPLHLARSPRARSLRLRIDPRTGALRLTVPRRLPVDRALAWATRQGSWVKAALATLPPAIPFAPGAIVPLYGVPRPIDWSRDRSRIPRLEHDRILAGGPAEGLAGRIERWLKRHALSVLEAETRALAEQSGLRAGRVRVGDPVSRWGSCSGGGDIRYSWRLILAPDFVRRATVAHEVAHLVHMDHSPAFHHVVERLLGADPRPARDWLRRRGAELHRIGRAP